MPTNLMGNEAVPHLTFIVKVSFRLYLTHFD